MARRSILFSPGDQETLLRKAPESGADVIVFDLEDAVAPSAKQAARNTVTDVLAEIDPDCECCIRINPLDSGGKADIESLAGIPTVDSLMIPKVSGPEPIAAVREQLDANDLDRPLLALLESAAGILAAPDVAQAPGVDALLFGAEDLSADIGATRTAEGTEVVYARQRVVLAASAEGIDAIDTLVTDFEDDDQLRADTQRGIEFGFDGKLAIHPRQVAVINEAFTPSPEEREWAERVLEAQAEADAAGRGVFAVDGEMIDAPLIAQAERIIERSNAAKEE